jgi:hypothetical protein
MQWRKSWNRVGETGLNIVEGKAGSDPAVRSTMIFGVCDVWRCALTSGGCCAAQLFLKNLKKHKRAMFRIALLITALFGLLVLQPSTCASNFINVCCTRTHVAHALFALFSLVLLILKIDDVVSGSWFAIWIPMLLLDGILMLTAVRLCQRDFAKARPSHCAPPLLLTWMSRCRWRCSASTASRRKGKTQPPGRTRTAGSPALGCMDERHFVLVQIFILLNLDGVVDWSWAVAFIPWMIYEANQLIELVPTAVKDVQKPDIAEPDAESGDAEETFMRYVEAEMEYNQHLIDRYDAQLSVVASLMRVLFLILLAVKLDSDPSGMKWAVVFIPIWLYFGYRLSGQFRSCCCTNSPNFSQSNLLFKTKH